MNADAARVLVVEDEAVLREAEVDLLTEAGFAVTALPDGRGLDRVLHSFRPDLVLMDVMLPGESGFALARAMAAVSDAAVLFVTARDAISDRLIGFDVGADDYVVKPFIGAELVARVRAVLRRSGRLRSGTVQVADLLIDEDAGMVLRNGHPVPVTATELRVLTYLARNRGRVLSKTQILTQVWGYDAYDPNLVETYVSGLRRKTEVLGTRLIHTVHGLGYRMSETPRPAATP